MDYKNLLVMVYFNTVQASYSYKEISNNFGLEKKQILNLISDLQKDGLIILHEYYKLTDKAIQTLKEYNLLDVDYYESFENRSIFEKTPLDIDEIYIPIGFTKKIK